MNNSGSNLTRSGSSCGSRGSKLSQAAVPGKHDTAATMRTMRRSFAMRCVLEFHAKVAADGIDVAVVERHFITIKLEMAITNRNFRSGCIDALLEADAVCRRLPALFLDILVDEPRLTHLVQL